MIKTGHERYVLPADKRYLQRMTLQRIDQIIGRLRHTLEDVERLRDDVHDPVLAVGMQTPYGDWAGRIVSTITQGFGNLGSDFQTLVNLVGEIDALLEDDRAASANDKARVQELERLAQAVVDKPSSRVAREALAQVLITKEN